MTSLTILIAILALAALIVVHELGHFALARLSGMKVERFSVGFGPVLARKQIGETEWAVSAVPLGGYVKIAGMDPTEDQQDPRAYNNKPAWARILVIAAGPIANYILAAALFTAVLMMGWPEADFDRASVGALVPDQAGETAGLRPGDEIVSVDGVSVNDWPSLGEALLSTAGREASLEVSRRGRPAELTVEMPHPPALIGIGRIDAADTLIQEVFDSSPAALAGLQKGDRIIAVDGEPLTDWSSLVDYVSPRAGRDIELLVERGEERLELTVVPEPAGHPAERIPIDLLGIIPSSKPGEPWSFGRALHGGVHQTWAVSGNILTSLGGSLARLIMRQPQPEGMRLEGPVGIVRHTHHAAGEGVGSLLRLAALISVCLGLFNLLPIPALDGGRLVFLLAEVVRRKPVSAKIELTVHAVGFILLLGLILVVTFKDVGRLIGG